MDYKKELLLAVASIFISAGAVKIGENTWEGAALLIIGAVIFIVRGFYKQKFNK